MKENFLYGKLEFCCHRGWQPFNTNISHFFRNEWTLSEKRAFKRILCKQKNISNVVLPQFFEPQRKKFFTENIINMDPIIYPCPNTSFSFLYGCVIYLVWKGRRAQSKNNVWIPNEDYVTPDQTYCIQMNYRTEYLMIHCTCHFI